MQKHPFALLGRSLKVTIFRPNYRYLYASNLNLIHHCLKPFFRPVQQLAVLNKFFYKYRWRFLLGIIFVSLSNYFRVLQPQMIRYALDLVIENISLYNLTEGYAAQEVLFAQLGTVLLFFGALVLILALLMGIFMYFMRQTIIVMSRLIEYDMRKEIFAHYENLNLAFYKKNNTGDLMSRITEDVTKVRMYLGPGILYGINLCSLFFFVIYSMLSVSPMLTFYCLLPMPFLSISIYYVSNLINKKSGIIQKQLATLNSGNIAEFVIYVSMLTWPITALGWIASIVQQAAASQSRINEFLTVDPAIKNPIIQPVALKGDIEFKNVDFVYPDSGIRAINDLTFKLKSGQKMAIIGKTGSGKTTIADLLLRMYDVTEGQILIDGKDIRTQDLANLRKKIGYVPQDLFLFSDTIAGNVAFGKRTADRATIEEFTRYASVYEDILLFAPI